MATTEEQERPLTAINLVVLILSIYVLGALLIDLMFELPPEVSRLLRFVDNAICAFFLIEFGIRFYKAENKLDFMKWGWIDLIASIPNADFARFGRAIRLIRIFRILRAFRSIKHIANHVFANRAKGTFTSVATLAALLIIFSSIAILQFENTTESNIKTAEDAIWWSYVTMTTVGYGDKYPVTTEGRIIGMLLMTAGVGLFGTFTGFISSWFVEGRRDNSSHIIHFFAVMTILWPGSLTYN